MDNVFELINHSKKLYDRFYKLANKYSKLKDESRDERSKVYQLIEILNILEKEANEINDKSLRERLADWLLSERESCDQTKDEFRISLGKQLSERFANAGKKVQGQFPLLRIGFYTVKFDFEFGEAALFFGPEIEAIEAKIPLAIDAIFGKLTAYDTALKSSPFDDKTFEQDLIQAYNRVLKLSDKTVGEKLPILKVLAEYVFLKQSKKFLADPQRNYFKGFSRVHLSYDLYRFKKSGMTDTGIHLHVATFNATTDKANSLWIPDNEDGEGTHYSYLSLSDERN